MRIRAAAKTILLAIAFMVGLGHASAQFPVTPHYSFCQPPQGASGWANCYNTNFTVLDTTLWNLSSPFQGAWSSGTSYSNGQYVTYGGSTYISTVTPNVGHTPGSSSQWQVITGSGGSPGGAAYSIQYASATNVFAGASLAGIVVASTVAAPRVATSSDIIALFASGSCAGFMRGDNTCPTVITAGQGGTGTTNLTGIRYANGGSADTAATGAQIVSVIGNNALTLANINGGTAQAVLYDFSGATHLKLPVAAGFTSVLSGEIGYDSTNSNWHIFANSVDNFVAIFPSASPPTTGDLAKFVKTGNTWTLADAGIAPGSFITSISIVTANGLQGSSSGGTTPALTIGPDSTHVIPVNNGNSLQYLTGAGTYHQPAAADLTNGVSGSGAVALVNAPTFSNPQTNTPAAGDYSNLIPTTQWVANAILGQNFKAAAQWATTGNLTATYSNGSSGVGATLTETALGALTVDGHSPAVGDRILVKNQTTSYQNGIYTVTVAGSVSVAYVLTRATDFNTPGDINTGDSLYVLGGTTNAGTTWAYNGVSPPTIGTTALTFAQTAGPGTYLAGNGLALSGLTFQIDTTITADLTSVQSMNNKTVNGVVLSTTAGAGYYLAGSGSYAQITYSQITGTGPLSGMTAGQIPLAATATTVTSSIAYGMTGNSTLIETTSSGLLTPSILPLATASAFGAVKVDGTTITSTGGVITAVGAAATSVTPGTTTVVGATAPCALTNSTGTTMGCLSYTSTNTASTIVYRDASGNFAASAITATNLNLPAQGTATSGTNYASYPLTLNYSYWNSGATAGSCTLSTAAGDLSTSQSITTLNCGLTSLINYLSVGGLRIANSYAANYLLSVGGGSSTPLMYVDSSGNEHLSGTLTAASLIATNTTGTVLTLGNTSGTSTTNPVAIDMGGTYSSTAGANPKLILYDGSGAKYGLGVSSNQMDLMVPVGGYGFYVAGSSIGTLTATGMVLPTGEVFGWNGDTGFSRYGGSDSVGCGNGTAGDHSCTFYAGAIYAGAGTNFNTVLISSSGIQGSNGTGGTWSISNSNGNTTLGTITTGVWNGTPLTSSYIPTNVAYVNASNTFTSLNAFGAGITVTGGSGAAGASVASMRFSGGIAFYDSWGANPSTQGNIDLRLQSSDGSIGTVALALTPTLATFGESVTISQASGNAALTMQSAAGAYSSIFTMNAAGGGDGYINVTGASSNALIIQMAGTTKGTIDANGFEGAIGQGTAYAGSFTTGNFTAATSSSGIFRSGNTSYWTDVSVGRTSDELELAVVGGAGQFFSQTAAGDGILKAVTGNLYLGTNGSTSAAIKLDGSGNTTVYGNLQGNGTATFTNVFINTTPCGITFCNAANATGTFVSNGTLTNLKTFTQTSGPHTWVLTADYGGDPANYGQTVTMIVDGGSCKGVNIAPGNETYSNMTVSGCTVSYQQNSGGSGYAYWTLVQIN